jgi:putative inorganic carbon (HCO3(-)) transporter
MNSRRLIAAPGPQTSKTQPPQTRATTGSWWGELVASVEWTPGFVTFLYYVFVVVTYWLPGGEIAMILALVSLLLRPQEWRMCRFLWIFAGFVAWCFLSYLTSSYRSASWPQMEAILKMWLIAFTAFNVIRSRAQLRFFLAFAIACFMLFPARGAFVNYFGGYTVMGRALWNFAYSNPNDLAAFALLFASMACAFFFIVRSKLLRVAGLGSVGVLLVLIFFTQSRGAQLAAGVVGVVVLLANIKNLRMILGGAALVLAAVLLAPKGAFDRVTALTQSSASTGFKGADKEGSAEQRYQLLQVAVEVASDYPAFGVGPGVYGTVHGIYARRLSGQLPTAGGNRDPHNTVMRTLTETGWIGLGLFVSMILNAWIRAYAVQRKLRMRNVPRDPVIRYLSFGLLAFMLAGLFGSYTYLNMLYLHLALLEVTISLSAVTTQQTQRGRPTSRIHARLTRPLAAVHRA